MICPDCDWGKLRLQLTNIKKSEESLFPKILTGFQRVLCPNCNRTGIIDYRNVKRSPSLSRSGSKKFYSSSV